MSAILAPSFILPIVTVWIWNAPTSPQGSCVDTWLPMQRVQTWACGKRLHREGSDYLMHWWLHNWMNYWSRENCRLGLSGDVGHGGAPWKSISCFLAPSLCSFPFYFLVALRWATFLHMPFYHDVCLAANLQAMQLADHGLKPRATINISFFKLLFSGILRTQM